MINKNHFFRNFLKLFKFIDKKEKFQFFITVVFMVIGSCLEVISIGALIPFVTAILSPEKLFNIEFVKYFFDIRNYDNVNLQLAFTIIFIVSIIFSYTFRIFVLYLVIRLSKVIATKFAFKVYKKTVETSYDEFKQKNSAEVISLITEKMDSISGVFFNFLSACSSLVISSGILIFLFFINFQITMISIFVAITFYIVIGITVKKSLTKNSLKMSALSIVRIKHVKETFGSIKQLILDNAQELFTKIFFNYDKNFRLAQFKSQFLSVLPRFLVETLGIVLITITLYIFYKILNYEPVYIITVVGALAFSAQKLLPLINNIYISYTSLINYENFILEINFFLENLLSKNIAKENQKKLFENIDFKKKINLEKISFKYKRGEKEIIKSLSFKINKGSKVGIIGPTGSGKSTLLDVIMGLLEPQEGFLEIDGKKLSKNNINSWRNKISHVPQDIFLFDATIEENIAFTFHEDNIDLKKVIESAKLAEIHSFIESLPNKYKTKVGENGILLSGGQKQRIGIARALFKHKEILTLDEATSALDINTEKNILDNINKIKGTTIIQITHRTNQLDGHDNIIKL